MSNFVNQATINLLYSRKNFVFPSRGLSTKYGFIREQNRGGARVLVDASEVGGLGVRLPCSVSGCRGRVEPGVGHGGRPILPLSVGIMLEASHVRNMGMQHHVKDR